MEEYEDMGSNALIAYNGSDATDATDATAAMAATRGGQEQDAGRQILQIMCQEEQQTERNESGNLGILKPTSGNAAIRKAKTDTRHGVKERSSNLTALKMSARQGADEKSQLEEWKADLLDNLTKEIAQIHKAHNIAMEAQREEMEGQKKQFQFEIYVLGERIRALELEKEGLPQRQTWRSESVEMSPVRQISQTGLNVQKSAGTQRSTQDTTKIPDIPKNAIAPPSVKQTEKRNYASVAASQPAKAPEKPWTKVIYKNRNHVTKPNAKVEDQGRRILFPRVLGEQKSEADLMLALNEALQKAGEGLDTRFIRVKYALSGAISALLTEQANAGVLLPRLSNLLIRTAKTVDPAIVGVEILEHWQRLKVHGMSLERYLGEGKMELLKREVELSMGIQLETLPRWLISEDRLREAQTTGSKRGFAIVITVKGETEAKKLCASGLRYVELQV